MPLSYALHTSLLRCALVYFKSAEFGGQSTIIGNTTSADGEGGIEAPVLFLPLTNRCSVHVISRRGILELESSRNCILTAEKNLARTIFGQ